MRKNLYRISISMIVFGIFGFLVVPSAFAVVVEGSFSGVVTATLTRGDAVLPGNIEYGDAVHVTFSYDTNTTSDSWPDDPEQAIYDIFNPISPNNWMQLEVNGLIWRSADEFYIHIYDDYTGNPNHILDRFYMGFGDGGSIVFPGYLGQGEIWYYLGADYNPTDTDTPFITSLSLPTALNDLNMEEVTTSGSSVSSRDGENVWLFRFNVDFATFSLSEIPPDTTPPEVINVSPTDGAVGISVSIERVRIEFSEPMDRATYSGNIYVEDAGGTRYGGCAYSGESVYEVVFCGQILDPNTEYFVHVTTGVTDIAGNHLVEEFVSSFSTSEIPPDTTSPEVINVSPTDGAVGISVSIERVRIEFSEPMDRATYSGNIYVEDAGGTRYGGCAYSGESVYEVVFCGQILDPNTEYFVHVTTGVTDIAGNHLVEEFVSSFSTSEIPPDTTPPEVINVSPTDGAVGISVSIERVRIEFSEPMDRATYSGNIYVEDAGGTRYGGCAYSGESVYEVVFCGQILDPNTEYFVHVTTGVTDIAGNHLVEEFVSSFTTEGQPTIDEILKFFDESVSDGTLEGDGKGNSANGRLNALRNMLEMAGDLIYVNDIEGACGQLKAASMKCDGVSPPPDFVAGSVAFTLYDMIIDLMGELGCE